MVDAILVGLEKTACLIDRCAVYELLYLNEATEASGNLEKSMLRLYTAILKFLAKAIASSKCAKHPRQTRLLSPLIFSSDNHIKAVFTTGEVTNYFDDIRESEETVARDAALAEAQCIIQRSIPRKSMR